MNSPFFRSRLPAARPVLRPRIFAGDVFLESANEASSSLARRVLGLMQEVLETEDVRQAHAKWDAEEFFDRIGALRRTLYLAPEFHERARAVAEYCGFERSRIAFDPIRLRVVLPGGHRNPLAAPVYYPHRDTWYAHPQCMVVWWVPLHDLQPEETFVFYPDKFNEAVSNDSEIFDYADWIKDGPALKIGWQRRDSGVTATYPRSLEEEMPEHAESFSCEAGDQLIFSGAHYHRTLPHDLDRTRYSLDFRVVHLDDVASDSGAPNADNRSRGSTLKDYVHP